MRSARPRPGRDDAGFTLLELMVVVLVIAILVAVAIPSFLGARTRAQDNVAKAKVRNAIQVELIFHTDDQRFTDDVLELASVDTSLSYTQLLAALTSSSVVYVEVGDVLQPDDTVVVGAMSASGTCFWIRRTADLGGSRFASSGCGATPAPGDFGSDW